MRSQSYPLKFISTLQGMGKNYYINKVRGGDDKRGRRRIKCPENGLPESSLKVIEQELGRLGGAE